MSANTTSLIHGRPETVTIVLRSMVVKVRRPLYCINCGGLLEFIYKEVVAIIQATASYEVVEKEIQCRKCKAIYEIC